ncbi:MAG: hydrogenase maturation nickel metallochaperone HypA [Dongiaceae bacterium]
MHEMTIASSLVELACDQAARVGAAKVAEINIRMGTLRGIARSLYFCFGSATRGTICEGALLRIDEVPLTVRCDHCDTVKTPAALYNFRCPDCGSPTPKVITGREMELVSLGLVPPDEQNIAKAVPALPAPDNPPGRGRRRRQPAGARV